MNQDEEPIWVFPLDNMCVGDSFWFPTLKINEMVYVLDCRAKDAGIRVRSFPCLKDGCIGVRSWRVR